MPDIVKTEYATRIIEALREGPRTISQLVNATGISDRQIRLSITELDEAKFILKAGYHNRSILWRLNSAVAIAQENSGQLPYHDIKVTGGSANLIDITLSAMVKCQPVPPMMSITRADYYTRTIFPLLAKYLGLILEYEPNMTEIFKVRNELLQAYKTISSTTFMLKQILEYEPYWQIDEIKKMREAPVIVAGHNEITSAALVAERYLEGESIVGSHEVIGE